MFSLSDDEESNNVQHRKRAKRGSKQGSLGPKNVAYYDKVDQKNIYWARKLVVMDMILESGWETRRKELGAIAHECLLQASANNHCDRGA